MSIGSWWCIGSGGVEPEVAKKSVEESRRLLRLIYDCYVTSLAVAEALRGQCVGDQ